jgi:methionine--tRNA ligase
MFLADRNIKGECPVCHAKDQYGDNCEVCGAAYQPTELINPFSVFTGSTPILKPSEQYFFKLSDPRCFQFLKEWLNTPGRLQPEMVNKVSEWLGENGEKLADWDISRDAPYFGIPIPDAPGKFFYVWLDAPVGYLASLKNYFEKQGIDYEAFLNDPAAEQVHFIGKDIVSFHLLFWPAMLNFSGHPIIDKLKVNVHGHLTVNNEKMSKSRGTGISPLRYLELGMNPEWLRYYLAFKLNAKVEDLDFTGDDFVARVNSDLIGKYVNIASRCAGFIAKKFDGKLAPSCRRRRAEWIARALNGDGGERQASIAASFEAREFGKALREIMAIADVTNQYVDENKPWILAKDESKTAELHDVCTTALILFRQLTIMLSPVLPHVAARVAGIPGRRILSWADTAGRERLQHDAGPHHRRLQPPDAARRREDGRRPVRQAGVAAGAAAAARRPARPAAAAAAADRPARRSRRYRRTGPGNLDRRLHQDRPARGEDRQLRTRRRFEQAAAPDPGRGRRPLPQRVLGHQVGLPAGRADRQADRDGRQPGAAQDEVRRLGRHGAVRLGKDEKSQSGPVPAGTGAGREPGMRIRYRETAVLVAEHLRDGGGFVLLVDERPVGSVRWLPLDSDADVWEICRMGVLPDYRGGNLSQHLLEAVIHHGLASGVEEVRLAVRSDQPKLIDFYTAFEFELAEELEYSHANPMEPPPLVMRRYL